MSDEYPADLLYTKEHEWARVEGNVAIVGITSFAVEKLGDITQIDLPKEGESISQDSVFGTVESVKAVSDLYAPVSGKIVKVNTPLSDNPDYLDDPYDEGWMIQIEMSKPDETKKMMNADAYSEYVREQDAE